MHLLDTTIRKEERLDVMANLLDGLYMIDQSELANTKAFAESLQEILGLEYEISAHKCLISSEYLKENSTCNPGRTVAFSIRCKQYFAGRCYQVTALLTVLSIPSSISLAVPRISFPCMSDHRRTHVNPQNHKHYTPKLNQSYQSLEHHIGVVLN